MAVQTTFKRYEIKYLMTKCQKQRVLEAMRPYMKLDDYGRTTIRNIYFDTPNYMLIRRSLEKPIYKEKLRIRSYSKVGPDDKVFIELKKKCDSIVYKRRLTINESIAKNCFMNNRKLPVISQIGEEIQYFREYYQDLQPAVFLSYEREAYYELGGGDFRVTFDENILYRNVDISLQSDVYGLPIIGENMTLMELKTSGGLPLWMVKILTELNIYKTSFSKYGSAYNQMFNEGSLYNTKDIERGILYA